MTRALALAMLALSAASCSEPPAAAPPARGGEPTSRSTSEPSGPAPKGPPRFVDTLHVSTFQRGNVHTHTTESDGNAKPEAVYAWYRAHGYAFLALSDHNKRTDPAKYAAEARKTFALVPAEEVTLTAHGAPVHLNAICHRARVGGGRFERVEDALAWGVKRIHEEGGVALVNHPNFKWAITPGELRAAKGAELLEIASGHPGVHTLGDEARPSHEAMWTGLLDAGFDIAPAGLDDMHALESFPAPGDDAATKRKKSRRAGPGRAWIEVFAAHADAGEICDGLRRGRLVASNGPRLKRLAVSGDAMTVVVDAAAGTVEFVGVKGAVLASQPVAEENVYRLKGNETYVRARVIGADKRQLWTRAYRVGEAAARAP